MYSSQSDTQERGVSVANHSEQSNTRSWKTFADLINASWRKGAESFLQTGRYLIEAKEQLEREEYGALIKLRLAFDQSVAKKLICIASNSVLGAHVHLLPPCWSTLYELTKLGDDVLKAALDDGTIHPGMQRKDAVALRHPNGDRDDHSDRDAGADNTASAAPSTFEVLLAAWQAASKSDHCSLFDRLGRDGIVAAMSPALSAELHDYALGVKIAGASSKKGATLDDHLTNLLHTALRIADAQHPSDQDKGKAFGSLIAMNRKLKNNKRSLCDIIVSIGKQKSKFDKKR